MRIIVTGNSGTGKTTVRLMLRSMAPHYDVIVVNAEMEAFLQTPSDPYPGPVDVIDPIMWLHNYVKSHDNVIVSMMHFYGVVDELLHHDIVIYMDCGFEQRRERVIARGNINQKRWSDISVALSAQTKPSTLPSNAYVIDNSGSKETLTETLIRLAVELQLRPQTTGHVDV